VEEIGAVTEGDSGSGKAARYVVAHGIGRVDRVGGEIKGDSGDGLPWKRGEDEGNTKLSKLRPVRLHPSLSRGFAQGRLRRGVDSPVEGSEQALTTLLARSALALRFSELPVRRASGHGLVRRVRVWVHACRVVDNGNRGGSIGFVTEWVVLEGEEACGQYRFLGQGGTDLSLDSLFAGRGLDAGEYVVFTAVEVAEKRVRHWVRLPWCNSLRVGAVRVVDERLAAGDERLEARDLRLVPGDLRDVRLEAVIMPRDEEGGNDDIIGERISLVVMLDVDGEGAAEYDAAVLEELWGLMIAGP
jgi:hypothetical protein